MRKLRTVLIIVAIAVCLKFFAERLYTKLPIHIDGNCDTDFENVRAAFLKNFVDGWERDGAAFTVYYDGKKVVDLWGGYADTMAARKWKEDTTTVTFSTTKAVAAICIAVLVDRGQLNYDDLVIKHWPGFGKHGKANVTIQMALSHMAGLGYLDIPITEDLAADHNKMRKVLEDELPKWPPGTATGYHIYTYGWIVDQIVRHVDKKKRSIGQFLREEISIPHDIDFHIGLPKEEQYRVARLTVPTMLDRLAEVYNDIRVVKYFNALKKLIQDSMLRRAASNPSWLQAVFQITVNNPDYQRLEQAAALGIGNSRSLAKLFDLVVRAQIIKPSTLEKLLHPYINRTDLIMGDQIAKGNGFLYLPLNRAGVDYVVGHTGHGCQQVHFDPKNRLAIAYVSNGLKTGLYDLCGTFARLHHTVYDIVENVTRNKPEQ
uniref:Beta-lactamase domain-containing protein n=1 Tax=Steinernema glaseri TaxID=37863 RepID=A0A1I7ZML8_9BILA